MSGGIGRKRARSEEDDGDATAIEALSAATMTGTIKRQRLAKASSIVRRGDKSDAVQVVGATAAATPKTPRTVHAVASAITGALAYGVDSIVGGSKRRGKAGDGQKGSSKTTKTRSLPLPFSARLNVEERSQHELDKLYDIPSGDADGVSLLEPESDEDDELLATPTSTKPSAVLRRRIQQQPPLRRADDRSDDELGEEGRRLHDHGKEEEDTLVGSASPTPDTPSKKLPSAQALTTPNDKKKKRRDPLGDLAIDGTDKLKSGLETNLSRHARVRSTPKKYLEGDGSSRPQDKADGRPIIGFSAGAVATTGASTSARKRVRPGPPNGAPQTTTPTKGLSSGRKNKPLRTEAPNENTPVAKRRGRPRKYPAAEEPAAGRVPAERGIGEQGGDVENDGEVCSICDKPDSEPPNEIVFCETCDLAVHQQCYNVLVIPEGDWFCKNCARRQQDDRDGGREDEDADIQQATAGGEAEAAPAALTATRDLAPDIANFEHHLSKLKRILLGRCTGRHRVRLQGQDEAYDKVYQVVKQTVVAGEGNSMMVIGTRGTGKTTMVETILEDLAAEHRETFHVVRLNGFIHTDDKLALREIWRQLGKEMAVEDDVVNKTNNYADTMASLLALLSHPSEILAAIADKEETSGATTAPAAVTSTSVVFVIDEFDLFATHVRQTLLYNLFDIAQARKAPIAVLGLTTKIDVAESLEKRVKSRFSHRYVYLSLPRSLPAYWDICRHGLVVEDDDNDNDISNVSDAMAIDDKEAGHTEFRQWWKHMIDTVRDDATFREQLEFHFYNSKSVPAFWTTCIMPLAALSSAVPWLQLPTVGVGSTSEVVRGVGRPARAGGGRGGSVKNHDDALALPLAAPDSKLHLLAALSELELSLLIAAARLDIVLSTDTVNFAMAYDEYVSLMGKQRVQSSLASSGVVGVGGNGGGTGGTGFGGLVVGGGARVWGRGVASRAWERLAVLGLLIPAGMGGSRSRGALVTSGLEGRSMWRTEVALEEIPAAPGVRLGAVLGRWCKEI